MKELIHQKHHFMDEKAEMVVVGQTTVNGFLT